MATRRSTRLIFGAMTGTSIDALDVAAVRVRGRALGIKGELLSTHSVTLGDLVPRLRAAQRQEPMTAGEFAALARDLALAHIEPFLELSRRHGVPDLAVVHGQTLYHAPPVSLQLIEPGVIAHALSCEVIANLRAADLAAGGQGAPITPLADWMMFRSRTSARFVVNLGGFANATYLPSGPPALAAWIDGIRGFDLCLCNQLLDHLARTKANRPFDAEGSLAEQGRTDPSALATVGGLLSAQRESRRSLGTRDELFEAIDRATARLTAADALATGVESIAAVVARALAETLADSAEPRRTVVLLAGGGTRNRALVAAIAAACGHRTALTDSLGVGAEAREAMAMALLGAARHDGCEITLPAVTGRGSSLRAGKESQPAAPSFTESSHG